MRIAYIINHDISRNDGVTKKVVSQVEEWKKLGVTVTVFCVTNNVGISILEAKQYASKGFISDRVFLNKKLISDLDFFKPNLVYYRYDTISATLKKIFKNHKTIAELNTNDLGEYLLLLKKEKSIKSLLRYLVYLLFRGMVFSNIEGIVGVTEEIKDLPSIKKYNLKSVCIPNSINLNNYNIVKEPKKTLNKKPCLFFIGTPNQPWHGVDIIEKMSIDLTEFDFHIVGIDGDSTANLFYHGYLNKEQYSSILKNMNICIGSLALYRNKMSEACPLKVREYLVHGFPTIIGYNETSFPDTKEISWLLNIDSKNYNLNKIKQFVSENKDYVVQRDQIECIDTKAVEIKRIEFFNSFV